MPAPLRPHIFLVSLAAVACGPDADALDDTGGDGPGPGDSVGDAEAEQLLYEPDGPGDLALSPDGRVLIATRTGGKVLSWEPGSKATDSEHRNISGLEGIHQGTDKLWACSSDSGVVGAVGWLESSALQEVSDQADDGTLFRYPRAITLAPDGMLLMADATVGALFRIEPDSGATTAYYLDITSPRELIFHDGTLYVAGWEGIYTVDYPGNAATRVDERGAYALAVVEGRVLAGNDDAKVFEVGGPSLGGAEIGRPGGLVALDDTLYVSDLVGSYVWGLPLED
jgi:hypothetical protein